eukprot:28208-Prymnesium_polylepis.1
MLRAGNMLYGGHTASQTGIICDRSTVLARLMYGAKRRPPLAAALRLTHAVPDARVGRAVRLLAVEDERRTEAWPKSEAEARAAGGAFALVLRDCDDSAVER